MNTAMPTRRLIGPKPAKYTPAVHTDVRRTFRKARLLARLRAAATQQGVTP